MLIFDSSQGVCKSISSRGRLQRFVVVPSLHIIKSVECFDQRPLSGINRLAVEKSEMSI